MSLVLENFYQFGEFTVDCEQRILLRLGKPLPLTPKVFDTLLMLLESRGKIVGKEDLMNQLWPDSFVGESNLTFNIQQLRKALGDNARQPLYIETVARRGYRFIARVDEVLTDPRVTVRPPSETVKTQLVNAADGPANGAVLEFDFAGTIDQRQAPILEPDSHERPLNEVPRNFKKPSITIAVAAIVLLAAAWMGFWQFSPRSKSAKIEAGTVGSDAPLGVLLKIENLTQTGESRLVTISPDGKYIAYTRSIEKKSSIWLRQLATNTNVEIVPLGKTIYGVAFSRSGEYLYFARSEAVGALYRVSLLGSVPTRIVDNIEGTFSISADDRQIAFIRQVINHEGQRQCSLMIANSDGTGERTLLVGTHPDELSVPLWSPDEQSLVCVSGNSDGGTRNQHLLEVRVADGTKRELSSDEFFHISRMAWLPNKSGLLISGRRNDQDYNQLWRLSLPGLEMRQITEALSPFLDLSVTANGDVAVASQATRISDLWVGLSADPRALKRITQAIDEFCWTANGRLVYASTASSTRDLWIMLPDGSEQRQLTVGAGWNGTPAVTADNRYIVFTSNRSGSRQVWRMDIDGSNQVQLTSGQPADYPALSPDGQSVFYNTTDDWYLWRVSINGGQPLSLTTYVASHPAVSPDGKMIACVGRNESKRELLILPIEGSQALKKFDFAGWASRIEWTRDGGALIYATESNGASALIKQSLAGGAWKKITNIDEDMLFDFGYSFDGRLLAMTRGGWQHDIVLINDLRHALEKQ